MRYSIYFQVYHGLHRLGKATNIFLCPCFPIFKMYRPKLSFPHSQRYLEDEWGDQWWMVKGLRKSDDPPTKACFPPLNSKDYQFLSRVQRTGPVRQHITCPLRMLLPLPRDFGWVWVILWKSTQVERSSLFHRKGQQTQSSLEPHCTSHPSSLLDILHIPCVFCDQVERGLNWAKEDNGNQVFPHCPRRLVLPLQRENEVHQWQPHSGNPMGKRTQCIKNKETERSTSPKSSPEKW